MEKSWKKTVLTLLKATLIVSLSLLAAGMLAGVVFGKKIKELAVRELNKMLATEVSVNGSINFSVFANFPSASVSFNEVELKEMLPEKNNLLVCERISLLFNIWDLFGSNYTVKKIVAQNGTLHLRITADGKHNYNILKPAADSTGKEFAMKIEDALFSGILVRYDDDWSDQHYLFDMQAASLSGDFSTDSFLLNINASFINNKLSVRNISYFTDKQVEVNGVLAVNLEKNRYTIQDTKIDLAGIVLDVSGTMQTLPKGNQLDLHLKAASLRVEELAALLPREYAMQLEHFTSKGAIKFDGSITGLASTISSPHVTVHFEIKDGTLSHDKLKESFNNVNLSGSFSNGEGNNLNTSYFNIRNFSTVFNDNPVKGTILLKNLVTPHLDIALDGEVSLEKITPLFPSTYVTALSGTVAFQQFFFKGPLSHLTDAASIKALEAGGSFLLYDVLIRTDQIRYDQINGEFNIRNNQVVINRLSFKANESDLRFTGSINNFIPYLLHSLTDTMPNRQKIGLNMQLASRSLSWTDLVGSSENTADAEEKTMGEYYSIPSLFYVFTGSVMGQIDQFRYDKFSATDVHGNILFLGNTIYFNDFGLNAANGVVAANGKLDISNMKRNKLDLTAKLQKLNITQLFYEFNNFGQASLTDKHIKGEITTELALQATWDERVFNKSKLYAVADVSIDNGELNDFDPMMALAKFVRISELKNIRFSRLQNQVEIKNQKIYIPQMKILTNALNLQLQGSHSFENYIDYKIQLNLLKLLTSKFEKSSSDLAEADKTTEGFLNLYLTMTGPADSPTIKYDKSSVKEKIAADLKKEKNELKKVLEQEFYEQEKDQQQIKDWKAPKEIEYMEFEEDTLPSSADENDEPSITKENQQKELDNFKSIFKPKDPAPK